MFEREPEFPEVDNPVVEEAPELDVMVILVTDPDAVGLFRALFQAFPTPNCCRCYLDQAGLIQCIQDRQFDAALSVVYGGKLAN
jgi:hypothetical protein